MNLFTFVQRSSFLAQSTSNAGLKQDVAVKSRESNLTYANWFCALCNNDVTDLTTLRGDISCNNLDIIDDCALDVTNDILIDDNYHPGQLRSHSNDVTYYVPKKYQIWKGMFFQLKAPVIQGNRV